MGRNLDGDKQMWTEKMGSESLIGIFSSLYEERKMKGPRAGKPAFWF